MPSWPHVWSSVGERHCVAFGGQLPVHTPLLQTLVQALPSNTQSPLSLHRWGDLPSVPPHRRAPGTQVPLHAPAVQRKGHGASPTDVHRPALEQRRGLRPSHFFASAMHSGAPASVASDRASASAAASTSVEGPSGARSSSLASTVSPLPPLPPLPAAPPLPPPPVAPVSGPTPESAGPPPCVVDT